MNSNNQTIKRNARIVYFVIILLGVLLSAFVFLSNQQVAKNTDILVNEEFPIFIKLQQLQSSLSQQERYLYEYYATQNRNLYTISFNNVSRQTTIFLDELMSQHMNKTEISKLQRAQDMITSLSVEFDINLRQNGNDVDWDLAREHLEMFTMYRKDTAPIVNQIVSTTRERVNEQYGTTQQKLQQTSTTVLAYSLLILFMAVIIGRYIARYIVIAARSKRLALFPERNPNPIISLSSDNHITYTNPATNRLLSALKINLEVFYQLIIDEVKSKQHLICHSEQHHNHFEIKVKDSVLYCELHWLPDQEDWDIHVMDITERKKAEQRLNYQAFHWVETGLFNKNKFYHDLSELTHNDKQFAMGAMEVRHYSQLVAKLGVDSTLKITKELAQTLSNFLKQTLTGVPYQLYQTSEKQFSLIIESNYCVEEMTGLVNKIEALIELKTFHSSSHLELDFGFCCYPEHASSSEDLVKCINMALENAISIEHSSFVIYSESLGAQVTKEIETTTLLRQAIEAQELELYFQPQMATGSGEIIGLETLIRWHHDGQFISPAEFIPLAEKSGLIIPLGQWIAEQACFFAKRLIDMGYKDLVVAINISPQQFKHPSFLDVMQGALAITQVPPQNIELEITEGVVMFNETDTITLLNKLRDMGFKLSIDDFGTGYSSLSYLKQFPINKLKIDQSFIKQIESNDADKAIVKSVIELGNSLGLVTIAEGVEQPVHLDILDQLGCHEIQGYLFSKPLPKQELVKFLESKPKVEVTKATVTSI